ncbi:MAG: DMT family transporter [Anaerolineaceae bacterium]|nr:DMT family transporter [Anaerolineaceae bacterium]
MRTTKSEPGAIFPQLMMVVGVLSASTGAIFIRMAQYDGVPSLVIAASRVGLATILLMPIALGKYNQEIKALSRRSFLLAFLSGVFLALHFATWVSSLEYTSVTSSVVLVSMSPLLVALLSIWILGERYEKLIWIGLVISLTGSLVVAFSQGDLMGDGDLNTRLKMMFSGKTLLGNVLAFAGAWFVSGYLIIGRKLRASLSLVPYTFLVFGMASLVLIVMSLASGLSFSGYPQKTYLWLILLAIIPQILGHATFSWGLKYLSATFIAIALLGEPIGSSIWALLLFEESPTAFEILGGSLILVGIFLASKAKRVEDG